LVCNIRSTYMSVGILLSLRVMREKVTCTAKTLGDIIRYLFVLPLGHRT
jgi:hypothetical protein